MTSSQLYCPVCAGASLQGAACPRCGYQELRVRPAISLPLGAVLHGEYTVGNPLGRPGGFGVTYLAWYSVLEQPVAIKEYLPTDLAGRSPDSRTVKSHSSDHESNFRFGIEQFLREARTLARLSHPNIVRVRGFFEENGTAYLVMDYYAGQSLDRLLEVRGGKLPEAEAVGILLPILDALQYVHERALLHRDVKPSNIYLKDDQTPILLDFGAARAALSERTQSTALVHTPGYAPFEQYHEGGKQGPWTDVYAAAATLYRLVTGVVPPSAIERSAKDVLLPPGRLVPDISSGCSRAVLAGLSLKAESRPQNAGDLRKLLVAPMTAPVPRPPTPVVPGGTKQDSARSATKERRVPWQEIILIGLFIGLVSWGVLWRTPREEPMETEENAATETPTDEQGPSSGSPPPAPGELRQNSVDGLLYVWIPPGEFQMGCVPGDDECDADEKPRHPVSFAHGFWVGQTEVTVAAYRRFTEAKGLSMPLAPVFNQGWAKADHPVNTVDWNDAKSYCAWAGGGRLPSEAEWEYAARGGREGTKYTWGDEQPICQRGARNGARFDDNKFCDASGTEDVHSFSANGYRLYGMAGNVWEWCEDLALSSYVGAPEDGSPWIAGDNSLRVLRGGSWYSSEKGLRLSYRIWDKPDVRFSKIGFRCIWPPAR